MLGEQEALAQWGGGAVGSMQGGVPVLGGGPVTVAPGREDRRGGGRGVDEGVGEVLLLGVVVVVCVLERGSWRQGGRDVSSFPAVVVVYP